MLGSTLWLTLATLTGLAAGFAREWLLVAAWGAGAQSDAFLVSMFLPEALRMALAAGLLSAAALPLYQQRDLHAQQRWLNALAPRLLLCGLGQDESRARLQRHTQQCMQEKARRAPRQPLQAAARQRITTVIQPRPDTAHPQRCAKT